MRNAPSVLYPVGRCRFYAGVLLVLGSLALAVLLSWWWPLWQGGAQVSPGHTGQLVAGAAGALFWLLWGGFAWHSWHHAPVGWLHWDARAGPPEAPGLWRWCRAAHEDGSPLQQVALVLDLQSRALLRLRNPDAAHRWVWVDASAHPARWDDLRRALRAAQA